MTGHPLRCCNERMSLFGQCSDPSPLPSNDDIWDAPIDENT